jgi:hypothetical protein
MNDPEDEIMTGGGKSDSFVSYLTTITAVEKNELINVIRECIISCNENG